MTKEETGNSDRSYRQLTVWQRAIDLVDEIYNVSSVFPSEEKFSLTNQIRRAAVSVAANIAEGYGRVHRKEYLHHVSMARGSLMEVETLLIIAVRREFLKREQARLAWELSQETGRMLHRMIEKLQ